MSKDIDYDLSVHTRFLLEDQPFFGLLSRAITKRATKSIPTAAVRVNPRTAQFELLYNPDFWMGLDAEDDEKSIQHRFMIKGDKTLLLMHEFYHCIFGHLTTRSPEDGMSQAWNVAMDLAINGELFASNKHKTGPGSLYEIGVVPGKPGTPFEKYPVGLTAEAYYKMIMEDDNIKKVPMPGMGGGKSGAGGSSGEGNGGPGKLLDKDGNEIGDGFDVHDEFGEVDAETQTVAEQRMKKAMKEAVEHSLGNGWGTVSSSMRGEILRLLKTTINWKAVLRYFVRTSQRSDKKSSIMRINRRHPYVFPGRKSSRSASIAIAIDQSGSVSDALLAKFFGELNGLANYATFTVLPFDTEVAEDEIFVWKKGQSVKPERVSCGGTCFQAPTDYVNQKGNFDGLIILTDMEAPAPGPCIVQRMWGTSEAHAERPYFTTSERVMAIPMDDD